MVLTYFCFHKKVLTSQKVDGAIFDDVRERLVCLVRKAIACAVLCFVKKVIFWYALSALNPAKRVFMQPLSPTEIKRYHVLVVDDDAKLRTLLSSFLQKKGFLVSTAQNIQETEAALSLFRFQIILLDVMLPKETGLAFVKRFQKQLPPVIFLTACGAREDRLSGLSLGAHDYITKPFEPEELFLRMRSILRHYPLDKKEVCLAGWTFLETSGLLTKEGHAPQKLTSKETKLLAFLLAHQGKTLSRDAIARALSDRLNPRSVDVLVARLRTKIERMTNAPLMLQSVRGVGYVMQKAI